MLHDKKRPETAMAIEHEHWKCSNFLIMGGGGGGVKVHVIFGRARRETQFAVSKFSPSFDFFYIFLSMELIWPK